MDYEKKIDIPFGAKDSELKGWEYTIPEGFTAEIKGGKVIVREKESDDERIRKSLVDYFGRYNPKDKWDEEFSFKDVLSYLEKQKEQKSIEDIVKDITKNKEVATKFLKSAGIMDDNGELAEMYRSEQKSTSYSPLCNTIKDKIREYVANHFVTDAVVKTDIKSIVKAMEEGVRLGKEEQKPVDEQFPPLEGLDAIKAKYYDDGFKNGFDEGVASVKPAEYGDDVVEEAEEYTSKVDCGEYGVAVTEAYIAGVLSERNRKPAEWSENDKKGLDNCCAIIAMPDIFFDKIIRQKCLDFLYELPERFNLQPKPEWSEEDEKMIDTIVSVLGQYIDYKAVSGIGSGYATPRYSKEIAWLNSLHPQPREEIYQSAKHDLAIRFMNYLDENRPEGKMNLSNGECEDIDKAFKENDWAKIMRYVEKYRPSWKPSEE